MNNSVRWSIASVLLLIVALNVFMRMHLIHKFQINHHGNVDHQWTALSQKMTSWMKSQPPAVVNDAFYHPVEYNLQSASLIGDRIVEKSSFYIEFKCSESGFSMYLIEEPSPSTFPTPYWTKRITTQDGIELKYDEVARGYILYPHLVKADLRLKVYIGDDKSEHAENLVIKTELTRSLIYATCTALIKNGLTVDDQWLL